MNYNNTNLVVIKFKKELYKLREGIINPMTNRVIIKAIRVA